MAQRRFSIGVALTLCSIGLALASWAPRARADGASVQAPAPATTANTNTNTNTTIVDVEERAQALEQLGELSPDVARPLGAAKIALERFQRALALGDSEGAGRAERVARAAVSLAERRLSLERERTLLRAAQARKDGARARAEAAKAALAHERERDRARGQPELSAPASVSEAP